MNLKKKIKTWYKSKEYRQAFEQDMENMAFNLEQSAFDYNKEYRFISVNTMEHDGYIEFQFHMASRDPAIDNSWMSETRSQYFHHSVDKEAVQVLKLQDTLTMKKAFGDAMRTAVEKHNTNMVINYQDEAVRRRDFTTELENQIQNNRHFIQLKADLEERDRKIQKMEYNIQDTSQLIQEQTTLVMSLQDALNETKEYGKDIDEIKAEMHKLDIMSKGFDECCVTAAQRLMDGSGRKYCNDCGIAITPEVLAVMKRQEVLA